MKLLTILLFCFFVHASLAATVHDSFTAEGNGAIIQNSESTWQSGYDNKIISGSSGSILLTAPGPFQYQTSDNQDATINNFYNSSGYSRFDNGGVFEESAGISTSDPYQKANVRHYGFLQTAEIDTAKFVEDSDLSIGQQAAWDGAGLYTRDRSYEVEAKLETEGKVYTYRTDSRDYRVVSTNSTGGARVRPEFSFTDFSDVFVYNTTTDVNETLNQSEVIMSSSMVAM